MGTLSSCCSRNDAVPAKMQRINTNDKQWDPYDIDEFQFGKFIEEKINEKTARRLMSHLKKQSEGDKSEAINGTDNDIIKATQCIHVLLFTCILYLKYKEKTEKRKEVEIDKKKLKQALKPSYEWMIEYKLKSNGTLKRSKYKILGKWLKEYSIEKDRMDSILDTSFTPSAKK